MYEHKNIKMSNLWQPFTDAHQQHKAKVFDQQTDSFDMTSLAASCAQVQPCLFCGSWHVLWLM
jgi:hypothetical protein